MIDLEVAIDLIVPDNTAYTVLVALRQLGYTALERVERSEIFRLQVDARPAEALRIVERIKLVEVLFNPNEHRISHALPDAPPVVGSHSASWEAIVTDCDDDTCGLVRLLRGPFGMTELISLTRGIAWRLFEEARGAPQARVEWACRQLLANPYSQSFVVAPQRSLAGLTAGRVEA